MILLQIAAEAPHTEEQNPLVPEIPELGIGLLAFAIVFFLFWKKLLPSINKVLEQRHDAIEGGIKRAAEAQDEAQQVLEEYRAQLENARHEANRLREEAREQGAAIIAEMRAEGQRQREAIIEAGHAQIEADRKQAAQVLRQDVGKLATDLAGRVVGESLDDFARQSRVIDRFLEALEERAEAEAGSGLEKGAAR